MRINMVCQRSLLVLFFLALLSCCYSVPSFYTFAKSKTIVKIPRVITFQIPITFYDEVHNHIKVFPSGFIGLDRKIETSRRMINIEKAKLIAPLVLPHLHRRNRAYTVKIYSSGEVISKATSEIQKFFHAFRDFEAEQVIIITWNHRKNPAYQCVIITNGKYTFLQLMYNENTKVSHKKSLHLHAGISAGDGVRFTHFVGRHLKNTERLYKESNVNQPGRWVYLIGSTEGNVFQVWPPTTSPFVINRSKYRVKSSLACYAVEDKLSFNMINKTSVDACIQYCDMFSRPFAMTFNRQDCSCLAAIPSNFQKIPIDQCDEEKHWFIYSTNSYQSDTQDTFDLDECALDVQVCSSEAKCTNTQFGFDCKCNAGYFGDGKVCIREDNPMRIMGKFVGNINGVDISDADLSGIVIYKDTTSYISINPIPESIGYSLQLASGLTDIIGWVFAAKKSLDVLNGLEIVGERFKSEIILSFDTGEVLTASHEMKGRDDFNYFVIDTHVQGRLPSVPPYAKVTIDNFRISMAEEQQGEIEGKTTVRYTLGNKAGTFSIYMKVNYQPWRLRKATQTFVVSNQNMFYDLRQILIRYQRASQIESSSATVYTKSPEGVITTAQAPSSTTSTTKTFPTTSTTVATDPQPTSTSSPTTTHKTTTTTVITKVTTKSDVRPKTSVTQTQPDISTSKVTCGGEKCHVNAACSTFGSVERCVCDTGYQGNGTHCQVDKRIKCGPNLCSQHAECAQQNGRLFCVCRSGFVGDGVQCESEEECYCHEDATCYNNGQGSKYCLCNVGFRGDGKSCTDINECNENILSCGPNAYCANTKGSFQCSCEKGYRKNSTQCVDIPECTENKYVCHASAECIELSGSFKCVCPEGFKFGVDGRVCIAEDVFLLISQGGTVKRLSIPYSTNGYGDLHATRQHTVVGVDYDCVDKMVYWTDISMGAIRRVTYGGSNVETIISGLIDPQGITVDWLGRNIFWTDTGSDQIGVSRLTGHFRKDSLIAGDMRNPRAIVCDPYKGLLYWTDWNRNQPRIEQASMDGSFRRLFVSDSLGLPNGLTVDYKGQRLCWTDAWFGTISCIGFDGTERVVLYAAAKYPFSLAMHGSIIYWTEWKTGLIGRYNRDKRIELPSFRGGLGHDGRLYDIKVVTPCPERDNPCSTFNGGCEYLCLMKSSSVASCRCPDNAKEIFPGTKCINR